MKDDNLLCCLSLPGPGPDDSRRPHLWVVGEAGTGPLSLGWSNSPHLQSLEGWPATSAISLG